MKRHLYQFNPDRCAYERIQVQPSALVRRAAAAVVLGLVLATGFVAYSFVSQWHVEERWHNERNVALTSSIHSLDSNYKVLQGSLTNIHANDNGFYRSILDLDKVDAALWQGGTGGTDPYANQLPLIASLQRNADRLSHQVRLQDASFTHLEIAATEKVERLVHMPVIRPVPSGILGGGFGYRRDPFTGRPQFHAGVDFDANMGDAVKTTGNGVVITAGRNGESGYGIQVEVDHGFGYVTKYAHLSRVAVKPGQEVRRGEVVGYVGNTGYSTGPHLHYEVIFQGTKVNPKDYFIASY